MKLLVSANKEDGVLQRTYFEFSRRNIEMRSLKYEEEGGMVRIEIEPYRWEDTEKVLKHLRRISGVVDVSVVNDLVREEERAW